MCGRDIRIDYFLLSVAYDNICHVIAMANVSNISCNHNLPLATTIIQQLIVAQSNETEMILTRNGNARFSRKLRMYSPNTLWFISHVQRRGEALTHTAAESNKNGVVGNTGRNIPRSPRINDTLPIMTRIILIGRKYNKIQVKQLKIVSFNRFATTIT